MRVYTEAWLCPWGARSCLEGAKEWRRWGAQVGKGCQRRGGEGRKEVGGVPPQVGRGEEGVVLSRGESRSRAGLRWEGVLSRGGAEKGAHHACSATLQCCAAASGNPVGRTPRAFLPSGAAFWAVGRGPTGSRGARSAAQTRQVSEGAGSARPQRWHEAPPHHSFRQGCPRPPQAERTTLALGRAWPR